MNRNTPAGPLLRQALRAKCREILSEVGWLAEVPRQVEAVRETPEGLMIDLISCADIRARLHLLVKSQMRPATFPAWAESRRPSASGSPAVPVLAMPAVSPRLAELCRRAGWSWLDLAGNCRIDIPGLLHVERRGHPPVHRPSRPVANLGSPAAARVIRVLLSPAHAGRSWTQRELRTHTGWNLRHARSVSLGLVNKVVRHLRDEGFVAGAGESGVRVRDPEGLLAAWREAYRFDRHQRSSWFTLLEKGGLDEALYRTGLAAGGLAAYAAFSAAERQAPHVRQARTWLYLAADSLDALATHADAKEVDSGENLVVLVPDDAGVFLSFEADTQVGDRRLGCTDPVQTYVDLCHCGGRGEEAAQALLEQRILPAWKAVANP